MSIYQKAVLMVGIDYVNLVELGHFKGVAPDDLNGITQEARHNASLTAPQEFAKKIVAEADNFGPDGKTIVGVVIQETNDQTAVMVSNAGFEMVGAGLNIHDAFGIYPEVWLLVKEF